MASKVIAPGILLLCVFLFQAVLSATSSLVVVGSVFCDTCSENQFSETSSYFIPGALVAVECSVNRKTASLISVKGSTDENGEFRLEIPCTLSHSLKRCNVHMLGSPESECNVPSITTFTALNLNSKLNRDTTYHNAGSFSYRPLKVPGVCYKSVRGRAALEEGASPTSPPLIPNIPRFNIPQLPVSLPFPPPISFPPFPFTLPSPPPARKDDASKANAGSAPPPSTAVLPGIPSLPKPTFPPIPSIPLFRPPPLPFQFPPIPFLTPPPPPPTQH